MKQYTPLKLILATLTIVVAGCSPKAGSDNADAVRRIAVIPKGTSHEFWKSVHFGAEKAADEIGDVEVIWKGPVVESDTGSQIEVVKDMITRGVDGIVLAPNQKGGLVDAVEEAIGEGIPVVIFDSGLDEGPAIVSYVATDNFKGGQMAADAMAKALGEEGDVILLRYLAGSESTEQRENGFLDGLSKYPDINVLSSDQYGGDTATSAKEKADQLLQLYGDEVDGVFSVCEPNANGTLEAIKNAGLQGKVKFIAFDPSDALIEGMREGNVHGIVLQDPIQMGYQSVMSLIGSLEGKSAEAFQSTGEYLATPDNMDEEEMKKLLKPQIVD
ncbi:ABC transporter substrate-binding protein [Roseiconus lacunae]|uniref:Substrate-binding domain-containing protein n=1 Tax=Roseiconus lacunae TaxID=2605694 RepID=A0ABT7PIT8_9BACT|nr:substrate-binding domain-containing protein [Roseiconus lacunae]MCD0458522.1 substrate-binding domain-containing protein [Roseiconus lacunae]MDM4016409.1 substrate-binding domain-containing protein [Roseiconus lacunae]WRQ51989.1 substrate-binding domain-containing protein [Stieleria sp. HD01]